MKPKLFLKKLAAWCLSGLFFFILLEIFSNVYLAHFASEEVFRKYATINQLTARYGRSGIQQAYSPHRYLGFYPTPNYRHGPNKHNSLGFRGDEVSLEKPEGTFRIVCLGGSTTYGMTDDYREAYPFQLQQYLRENGFPQVEVVNAGAGMYTSWEMLVNLQFRVLELHPDLIIIYEGINDVYPRIVWPHSAYRADNSGAEIASVTSLRMPPIWHYSTVIRMLLVRFGFAESHSSLDWNMVERPLSFLAGLHRLQVKQNRYPSGIFLKEPVSKLFLENPPIYFQSNLRSLIAIAKANEIKVVLVTFAYSPFFDDPAIACRENQAALKEHNDVMKAFGAEANVFDFAAVMPQGKEYYLDGYHFSPSGNKARAQLIGAYLINGGLLDSTGREEKDK